MMLFSMMALRTLTQHNPSPYEDQVAHSDTLMDPANEISSLGGRVAFEEAIEGGEDGLVLGNGVSLTPFGKIDKMTFFERTPH
jgi:hypothetical protein